MPIANIDAFKAELRALKDALAALGERDSVLRAAVMARLAPALFWQVSRAPSYEEIFAMSREAIARSKGQVVQLYIDAADPS